MPFHLLPTSPALDRRGLVRATAALAFGPVARVSDAVLIHNCQGSPARNAFSTLTTKQKSQLLAFLNSL